jgi:hypothetical protein
VISESFPYFVREMVKLSKQSSSEAKQRRMIRDFAILGATTTPLVSGVLSAIEKGEFAPKKGNPYRWMASRIAGGLVGGALFPTIRRNLIATHRKKKS